MGSLGAAVCWSHIIRPGEGPRQRVPDSLYSSKTIPEEMPERSMRRPVIYTGHTHQCLGYSDRYPGLTPGCLDTRSHSTLPGHTCYLGWEEDETWHLWNNDCGQAVGSVWCHRQFSQQFYNIGFVTSLSRFTLTFSCLPQCLAHTNRIIMCGTD